MTRHESGGYVVWTTALGAVLRAEPGDFIMFDEDLRFRVNDAGAWVQLEPYSDDWTTCGAVVEQAAAPAWEPGDDVARDDAQMREWYLDDRRE